MRRLIEGRVDGVRLSGDVLYADGEPYEVAGRPVAHVTGPGGMDLNVACATCEAPRLGTRVRVTVEWEEGE